MKVTTGVKSLAVPMLGCLFALLVLQGDGDSGNDRREVGQGLLKLVLREPPRDTLRIGSTIALLRLPSSIKKSGDNGRDGTSYLFPSCTR